MKCDSIYVLIGNLDITPLILSSNIVSSNEQSISDTENHRSGWHQTHYEAAD